jgi:hypothetical protein
MRIAIGTLGWLVVLAWPRPAPAGWLGVGVGVDGRDPSLTAAVDAGGELVASLRGSAQPLGGRTGGEVTALLGIGPSLELGAPHRAIAWDPDCVARLAAGGGDRCWVDATTTVVEPPHTVVRRAWALLAGARAGTLTGAAPRIAGVVAARWHFAAPGDAFHRDLVELGVTGLVAGRDHPYLLHESFMPGWYARLQIGARVMVALELGVTGLALRDAAGVLRPELYGRAAVLLAWGR